MRHQIVSTSRSARKFMEEKGITAVTFELNVLAPKGACCLRVAKEIEPVYRVARELSEYHRFEIEGRRIFVAKKLKIYAPMKLVTEGFGFFKRLALSGVTVTI